MTFWRSNLNIARYRRGLACALILMEGLSGIAGWAADEADWPDQIYFPQKPAKPTAESQAGKTQKGTVSGSAGVNIEESAEPKKRWGLFKKKPPKAKPLTEEQITQVGPKNPPAYPDPLLRLSFPVQTEQGLAQPGFYLVRQLKKTEESRTLAFTRQHQIVFQCVLSLAAEPVDMGPVEPVERSAPPRLSVAAELSPDQKTVTIVLKEGPRQYKSLPLPTVTDARKILGN